MTRSELPCDVAGCETVVGPKGAKGFCPFHYRRFKATGDPLVSRADIVSAPRPCPECGEEYSPRNAMTSMCRPCRTEFMIEYNKGWRDRNPGYHAEWNRRWREANPEKYRAYYTQYRLENLEAVRRRFAQWEARNPRHSVEWAENNRERAREIVRRRRARLRAAETFEVTDRDIRRMVNRFGGRCAYCEQKLGKSYHVDHVVPLTRRGTNGIGNLVPACPTCNVSKSNWFLSEWRFRDKLSRPLRRPTVMLVA